jgi:hypothetical protein
VNSFYSKKIINGGEMMAKGQRIIPRNFLAKFYRLCKEGESVLALPALYCCTCKEVIQFTGEAPEGQEYYDPIIDTKRGTCSCSDWTIEGDVHGE